MTSGANQRRPGHDLFAKVCGNEWAGLLLWHAMNYRGEQVDGWFARSQNEWQQVSGMGRAEIEAARRILRTLGFWEEQRRGIPARLYFRVDTLRVPDAIAQWHGSERSAGA